MTDLISWLDSFGRILPSTIAWLTVWTAALLLAARAADALLARHVGAAWRQALYLSVLARLALPVGWASPLGVMSGSAPATAPSTVTIASHPTTALAVGSTVDAATPVATASIGWPAITAAAYLAVALGLLAHVAWSRLALARALRRTRPARAGVARHASNVTVLEHDELGPAVVGLVRPRIVVPTRLIETLDDDGIAAVLRHEAAHVERRDPWLVLALQVIAALSWPVLPVWLAVRRLRVVMEEACDAAALAGRPSTERRSYGRALLSVADWMDARPILASSLPFGSALSERIRALRHPARWPAWAQVTVVLTLAAISIAATGRRPTASATAVTPGDVSVSVNVRLHPRCTLADLHAAGFDLTERASWGASSTTQPVLSAQAIDDHAEDRLTEALGIPPLDSWLSVSAGRAAAMETTLRGGSHGPSQTISLQVQASADPEHSLHVELTDGVGSAEATYEFSFLPDHDSPLHVVLPGPASDGATARLVVLSPVEGSRPPARIAIREGHGDEAREIARDLLSSEGTVVLDRRTEELVVSDREDVVESIAQAIEHLSVSPVVDVAVAVLEVTRSFARWHDLPLTGSSPSLDSADEIIEDCLRQPSDCSVLSQPRIVLESRGTGAVTIERADTADGLELEFHANGDEPLDYRLAGSPTMAELAGACELGGVVAHAKPIPSDPEGKIQIVLLEAQPSASRP